MKIERTTVERVAALARLQFTEEGKDKIQADMQKIVSFIDKLNELDTEGVEPLIFMSDAVNTWREDIPAEPLPRELALKNAPQKDSDYYKVPKVLERE